MNRSTSLLARFVAILAAIVVCGGQWTLIQVVAWSGMALSYSATDGVKVGLQKTFSGENPCALCHVVKVGQEEEQKSSPKLSVKAAKLEAPLSRDLCVPAPQQLSDRFRFSEFASAFDVRTECPPTPPPRIA